MWGWSGQSFDEPAVLPVGKFKAAEARYATVTDVDADLLRRWVGKAQALPWDFKTIAKNEEVLLPFR
jgi:hypothetical protein